MVSNPRKGRFASAAAAIGVFGGGVATVEAGHDTTDGASSSLLYLCCGCYLDEGEVEEDTMKGVVTGKRHCAGRLRSSVQLWFMVSRRDRWRQVGDLWFRIERWNFRRCFCGDEC